MSETDELTQEINELDREARELEVWLMGNNTDKHDWAKKLSAYHDILFRKASKTERIESIDKEVRLPKNYSIQGILNDEF